MNESDFKSTPLYTLEPLTRFSGRAQDYAQHRPSYPAAAIALILDGLNSPSQLVAADIGAGTGISAWLLADQGVRVWAIEPNADMRQAAESHPQVTFQPGTAEQTELPDGSVDLVTCFQAFHWFDPATALPEFRRILKPSGRLAVVWNGRDCSVPFTADYTQIVQEIANHHPAESRLVAVDPLHTSPDFTNLRQLTFPYQQPLNLAGLIGRAQSTSYVPQDEQSQKQLTTRLTALFERSEDHQGLVYLSYQTQVYLAEANQIIQS